MPFTIRFYTRFLVNCAVTYNAARFAAVDKNPITVHGRGATFLAYIKQALYRALKMPMGT